MKIFPMKEWALAKLKASGVKESTQEQVAQVFDDNNSLSDLEELVLDYKLKTIQTLSMVWIVSELRSIVEGPDKRAAVEALSVLARISPLLDSFEI
jgi:SRSO17 transposase